LNDAEHDGLVPGYGRYNAMRPARTQPRGRFALRPSIGCLSALGVLVSCESHALTQAELSGLHRSCQSRIERGFEVQRSRNVGFNEQKPRGTPVVIYGADWCEPCHLAAEYLEMRGIPFVRYDVERDVPARAAMHSALRSANVAAVDTLPVLDIRGTVMAGFNPCVVDAAWAG
jgi:glutaredoxin